MPLHNFLLKDVVANIRRADVVFHAFERDEAGELKSKEMAHVGLAAEDQNSFRIGGAPIPVLVYHMGKFIDKDHWVVGARCQVDLCGVAKVDDGSELDDVVRDSILDVAFTFPTPAPSILNAYWMGDPAIDYHPLHPNVRPAYGFSCASFAHHCYSLGADLNLVDSTNMPLLSDEQRVSLQHWFTRHGIGSFIQKSPFRRLYPSYLMGAFLQDIYPFSPPDWSVWQHHAAHIPLL